MNTELERIEAEALKLGTDERERLVDSLLASLEVVGEAVLPFSGFATAEKEQSWIEECERRLELIKRGEMATYPAEEVFARLEARLRR